MEFYPCKKCGGTVAVMKQKMSGFSYFRVNLDESAEDNSDMYDSLDIKDCWKNYRCVECNSVMPVVEQCILI